MTSQELEKQITRSKRLATGAIIVVVGAYVIRFGLVLGAPLSDDPEKWGQFGDYLGGALNPLIAFLAFYWLTQSIRLQREELSDTKLALQDSAQAQLKQERHALRTAKVNALSALLTSHNNDISNLRGNIEFVGGQLRLGGNVFTPDGRMIGYHDGMQLLEEMTNGLRNALARRLTAMDEVTALLREDA